MPTGKPRLQACNTFLHVTAGRGRFAARNIEETLSPFSRHCQRAAVEPERTMSSLSAPYSSAVWCFVRG